jgi:membrane-bound lytic murein transglycosylase D
MKNKTMLTSKSPGFIFKCLSFLLIAMLAGDAGHCKTEATDTKDDDSFVSFPANQKRALNKHARAFVKNYIASNRSDLNAIRKRSRIPFSIIDSVFTHYGLPTQLKYLAVIESDLKTKAVSRVGAKGPWQLMAPTAQILGLKITRKHDERTGYDKSTVAAARYLKDLYAEFGDWLLVLAAYNGGPGPVHHAIRMAGSNNFWALQYYLPAESRTHVKRFIATEYYFEGQDRGATASSSDFPYL